MAFLDTPYKRKSAVLTSVIAVLLLILLFVVGLTYFDPPKEFGIAVNFGTTDYGSGNQQPTEALKPASQSEPEPEPENTPVEEIQEEVLEEAAASESQAEESSEDVMTQVNEEAIALKKREEAKRKAEAEAKAEADRIAEAKRKAEAERQAEIERQRIAEQQRIEKQRAEEAAKRKNLDALMGGFSDTDGKADGGEGDDDKTGDKGKVTGDPNAPGYYGVGGDGTGGNYRLGNRKALNKPKPEYDCNEEGRVVVSISVDQSGRVVSAEPGIKGTTNSAQCLLNRAKEAALKTKFNADSKAPAKQIGAIIYNFSLSE
ncbi:energy transducer TonB [Lutimonas zeaxanthinifaciens]|uniref:energy transducer TonB n=1 Tax=Lutimonas zeaxanthinifaciens TaxID=3060215 RepID=UPI00265CF004|nr:energy transducer TonB [Lutimonas sp. YSD2104]WKK65375.1 energy transducer TonB [Lutimonas sp. YSD2104]